jgi:hypothetical protein
MKSLIRRYLVAGMFLGCALVMFRSAHAGTEPLRRIGLAEDGSAIEEEIDSAAYTKELAAIVSTVSDSSLPVLNRENPRTPWKLETFIVGIGVGMEFGIGPILKLKATPRLRLAFTRSADAVLP